MGGTRGSGRRGEAGGRRRNWLPTRFLSLSVSPAIPVHPLPSRNIRVQFSVFLTLSEPASGGPPAEGLPLLRGRGSPHPSSLPSQGLQHLQRGAPQPNLRRLSCSPGGRLQGPALNKSASLLCSPTPSLLPAGATSSHSPGPSSCLFCYLLRNFFQSPLVKQQVWLCLRPGPGQMHPEHLLLQNLGLPPPPPPKPTVSLVYLSQALQQQSKFKGKGRGEGLWQTELNCCTGSGAAAGALVSRRSASACWADGSCPGGPSPSAFGRR